MSLQISDVAEKGQRSKGVCGHAEGLVKCKMDFKHIRVHGRQQKETSLVSSPGL